MSGQRRSGSSIAIWPRRSPALFRLCRMMLSLRACCKADRRNQIIAHSPLNLYSAASCCHLMTIADLCGADQNPDPEHDGAAEHDLEDRLQERRVHVACTNEGDGPEFEEHDHTGNRGCDPERIRPGI